MPKVGPGTSNGALAELLAIVIDNIANLTEFQRSVLEEAQQRISEMPDEE